MIKTNCRHTDPADSRKIEVSDAGYENTPRGPKPAGKQTSDSTDNSNDEAQGSSEGNKPVDGGDGDRNNSAGHAPDPYANCLVEHMTYLSPDVNLGNYDFAANGKTTKDGHIVKYSCNGGTPGADGGATNNIYVYVPNGQNAPAAPPPPPPPPPPDPRDLALTASKTLTMPKPHMHWGPLPDQAVVHYPLWFWVDDPGAVGTAVTLRGVTVTMRATIDGIDWRTGEPTNHPDSGPSPQAVVHCTGRGEPAPSVEAVAQVPVQDRHPACGHAYQWKSTSQRTNGTGSWPITATVNWTLAWTSTINGATGPGGSFALQSTNTARIEVLELTSTIIDNPTGEVHQPG